MRSHVVFLAALSFAFVLCSPVGAYAYSITQLTFDQVNDFDPSIHGGRVAYTKGPQPGSDSEVYLWEGGVETQVSSGLDTSYFAHVSGTQVAYTGRTTPSDDQEIYVWDGANTVQLTDNDVLDGGHGFAGSVYVYGRSVNGAPMLHLWDGTHTMMLNSDGIQGPASVSTDELIAWQERVGNDEEIFLFDGSDVMQLTDNDVLDSYPSAFEDKVVWTSFDGHDSEIFMYDGTRVHQITDNDINDTAPEISGDHVVWTGYANGPSIFHWDGVEIHEIESELWTQVTPGVEIDGLNIVLAAVPADVATSALRTEIFMVTIPEASADLLVGLGLAAIALRRKGA